MAIKNRFVVTITDIAGSKQYNIHQYVKQIILYIVLFIVAVFFFSAISIRLLLNEVKQIKNKRDLMQQEFLKINEKNEQLQALIDEKTEELTYDKPLIIDDKEDIKK